MKILVTGAAGFIGFHLVRSLVEQGYDVMGLDNLNDYYDINLKLSRLHESGILVGKISYGTRVKSSIYNNYEFVRLDLVDNEELQNLFKSNHFAIVCNLAAQAGVRYSLTNPRAYAESNLTGFLNILECCRVNKIKHLVYASSSSVYGLNQSMPFSADHNVNHPVSLYAATKKSNELMAHSYSHLYGLPTTGLRFFTVYGPWGRPDMALFTFTKAILDNQVIDVYNNGLMKRDFTYIDDIIDGIVRVLHHPAERSLSWDALNPECSSSIAPYKVYNLGRGQSINLLDFIKEIEIHTGKQAIKQLLPLQNGDVIDTWADIESVKTEVGYNPKISLDIGVKIFVEWYQSFYQYKMNTPLTIANTILK